MTTIAPQTKLRISIGQKVRQLRQDRRWTQTQLAELLGLSQNRLSEIEHGKGSLTAEQLLTILKTFNVSLDQFVPAKTETVGELQNALARLGAAHLVESHDVLPTERLKDALDVIRETLASYESPRQIVALAPVLANHAEGLNLAKLKFDLDQVGLGLRLGWVLENTLAALKAELAGKPTAEWARKYGTAGFLLSDFLSDAWPKAGPSRPGAGKADKIIDRGIASEKTLEEVRAAASSISRRWGIVSRIHVADFVEALRAARGIH
ncbi:MAG: helix-turn-helix transcriptional regulator [Elusimicrobia bacterium]|nr:helix-turn-helix transcriptional regulator [Elusimicrobiota bacterium]